MSINIKAALKPLFPAPVLEQWRRLRFNREQAAVRNKPLPDVFNDIYARGVWRPQGESALYHSGPGSMAAVTAGYEEFVARTLNADPAINTLVDIGCGDFQVSGRILQRLARPITYIGCDIASLVVADNQTRHGIPGRISFRTLDVASGTLPQGDIVTIREVFQHLSNATILAALANLRGTFRHAIITESLPLSPATVPNLDIVSGYRTRDGLRSGVFLDQAPFSLKILDRYDSAGRDGEILRTLLVEL